MNMESAARLVEQFENGTLPKEEWTHTAHCVMAFWYCVRHPLPVAVRKIREGIQAYNGPHSDGYHETVTLFYTATIARYVVTTGVAALTDEQIALFESQPFLAKGYAHQYYSAERLKDARHRWLPPDRRFSE